MRSRLLPRALVPLLALALLSGCSDEPEPNVADPPSSAPPTTDTTKPTPTETATTSPSKDETPEEFVTRWQELAEEMQATGDADEYLAHTRNCRSCTSFADTVSDVYSSGGSISGGAFEVRDFIKVGEVRGVLIFEYVLDATPTIIRRPGRRQERYPGGQNRFQINLIEESGAWLVTRLSGVPL